MNKCLNCDKKLRRCKYDFERREYHFKCIDIINKEKYEEELKDFIKFLTEQINKIDLDKKII